MIDVAASSKTGEAVPQVAFITTSNTIIGQDLLDYAERRGVFITQTIVKWDGNGTLTLGRPTQLNMWESIFVSVSFMGSASMSGPPGPDNSIDPTEVEDLK